MAVFNFLTKDKTPAVQPVLEVANESGRKLIELPTSEIMANPYQPRETFDEETILELAQSIEKVGLIQPLLVRKTEDGYELVAGERRLRAVRMLGFEKVTCILQSDLENEGSAMMALIENLQREDLHFLEEAKSYASLINEYDLTQEELAERLGKSQSFIANKLRLLKIEPEVMVAVAQAGLSERHARALLKLKDSEHRLEIIGKAAKKNLSVKETEKLVETKLNKLYDEGAEGAKPRPMVMRIVRDYRLFMNTINAAVATLRESGMSVEVEQVDCEFGVDIKISVRK